MIQVDMDRRQLSLRIAFSQLRGINQMLAREILARIGSEEAFFEATDRQLAAVMGFSNRIFDRQYRDGLLKAAEVEADFTEPAMWMRPILRMPIILRGCMTAPTLR